VPSAPELQNAIVAESHGYWHALLRQVLPELGLEPLIRRSAEDAINLAGTVTARLIILGAVIPDMDALRARGLLRSVPCCQTVPIVILMRRYDPELRRAAVHDAATLPLSIPLSLQQLRHGILQVLGELPDEPIRVMQWPPRREPTPIEGGLQGLARGNPSWRRTNYSR
jgi:CheY-like chemotaxis protein